MFCKFSEKRQTTVPTYAGSAERLRRNIITARAKLISVSGRTAEERLPRRRQPDW